MCKIFKKNILVLGLLLLLLGSCVPNKKLVYLQNDDELKHRKDIPVNEVLRTRPLQIEEYRIQPLDNLLAQFLTITDEEFDFFSRTNPSRGNNQQNNAQQNGVIVDAEGFVEFPVIGKVQVVGLTIFEAQDKLQQLANRYLKDVVVRVRMLNFRFTVLGEVGADQVVTTGNTRITMMEAIGMTGGFAELADRSKVKVIRQHGDEVKVHYVNLLEEEFIESEYFYVKQNDIIIVPPLKQRTFRRYFASNLGLLTTTVSAALFLIAVLPR